MHQLVHFFIFCKIILSIFATIKDQISLYTGILIDLGIVIKFKNHEKKYFNRCFVN
jgi:hypothetical protein